MTSQNSSNDTVNICLTYNELNAIRNAIEEQIRALSPNPELCGTALVESVSHGDREMVEPGLVEGYLKLAA